MQEVALIVGGGPGTSASCARLFARQGMQVVIAARTPDKPVLNKLAEEHGVKLVQCDASDADSVSALFQLVTSEVGAPNLVVHNIDGRPQDVFRKSVVDLEPEPFMATLKNSTYSAFLVAQQAARAMLGTDREEHKGTIIFTNASAAIKGFPLSSAFAAASQGKFGFAQSLARELMSQGIHVAHVPIDGAIAPEQEDGSRAHWLAGESKEDNMLHPERIADVYLQLHRQHRSTWAFDVVLRPWTEKW